MEYALAAVFIAKTMNKIITEKIKAFLAKEKPTDEEIKDAAFTLLQVGGESERHVYNSAQRRPQAILPWIRTDLRKFLDIRNRGLERSEVPAYNAKAVRNVRETLSRRPDTVEAEKTPLVPVTSVLGKRADHDSLPEDIRQLWDKNAERWKKIRQLHAQLQTMIAKPGYQPCDGNELCHTLLEADTAMRRDYERYDKWQEGGDIPKGDDDPVKLVQKTRTALSRALNRKTQDEKSLARIREILAVLKENGAEIKPATRKKLSVLGIDA